MKKSILFLTLLIIIFSSFSAVLAEGNPPLDPIDWQNWPVIPTVSERAREIYQEGIANGNDSHSFTKIADCQNIARFWMGYFDNGTYELGEEYAYLEDVIQNFKGSYERDGVATQGGYNVAAVLNPFSIPEDFIEPCETGESPVDCELRLVTPSITFISLEQNWSGKSPDKYGGYLRMILEKTIEAGSLPILITKADNIEGDHSINQMIATLAVEYDIPLWNFWAAVQELPYQGVSNDGFHLTVGDRSLMNFTDGDYMTLGVSMRNLTGLQTLDAVWQAVR